MLSLVSWNVNGIRAVFNKGFAETLRDMEADIVCLQEIKAKEAQLSEDMLNPCGYTGYFFPAERPGYSGVAVYSRIKPEKVMRGLGIERFDREGRSILLDFGVFRLLNVYFPNGGSGEERLDYKLDFNEALLAYVRDEEKPLLICGDVNVAHKEIDIARPRENINVSGFLPIEREWVDRLLEAGFHDTFRMFSGEAGQYSWWNVITRARSRNVGWRIDYFFANDAMRPHVRDAWIWQQVLGSDHCPVGVKIDL